MIMTMDKAFDKYAIWLENLTRQSVAMETLKEYYSSDARFRDPFNDCHGIEKVQLAFDKMFDQLDNIHLEVTERAMNGPTAFISWNMSFQVRGKQKELPGVSQLRFDEKGLVSEHLDFWDASPAFDDIPIIGCVTKLVRKHYAIE